MIDLNSLPNAPLKIIFAVHFFLCAWGIQGSWSPDSYFFYNLLFFITLMWAIQCKDALEPVEMAIFIGVASIVLDIIVITIYFPSNYTISKFSVGMAIINLLVRPVTALVLLQVRLSRQPGSISFGATAQRGHYEDIDRVREQPPHAQRGFDGGSPSFAPIIFAVHFFLCAWGIQGSWSPDSYFFYNLLFFITLMWAIQCKDAWEPIEMAIFIGVASIVLDIIVITIYFPSNYAINRFSVAMAIINLLVRPVTALVLCDVRFSRQLSTNLRDLFGATAQRGHYEDIDRVREQPPHAQRGFDGGSPSFAPVSFASDGADTKSPPA